MEDRISHQPDAGPAGERLPQPAGVCRGGLPRSAHSFDINPLNLGELAEEVVREARALSEGININVEAADHFKKSFKQCLSCVYPKL